MSNFRFSYVRFNKALDKVEFLIPSHDRGLSIYGTFDCEEKSFVQELPDKNHGGYYAEITLTPPQEFGKESGCPMWNVPITIEFKGSTLVYIGTTYLEMTLMQEFLLQ